ncbi:MAG: toll/interleukin-1 receptor domain-containing protein, partial [Pseudomonadales bacterium]
MSQAKYSAFLSYSHTDLKWGKWLHSALERYRLPRGLATERNLPRRLAPVFRDTEELAVSSDLSEAIVQALTDSEFLIVICSPSAAQSSWVNREIELFVEQGKADRIICLLVDGSVDESIPATIRNRAEPLAADVRPGHDNKRKVLLRIAAGLHGLAYSDLHERHARRTQLRLTAIAAASLVALTLTGSLAAAALIARDEAVEQRLVAEQQTQIAAETRDFLIDLFRLSDPNETQGNQVTARELLDRASKSIDEELANDPLTRATLMETMSQVYENLGIYPEALVLSERSLLIREEILGAEDLDSARALFRAAAITSRLGRYDEAAEKHREVLDARRASLEPDDSQIAESLNAIGESMYFLGRTAEAHEHFQSAHEIWSNAHGESHIDVATVLNNLAATAERLGDWEQGLIYQKQALDSFEHLAGDHDPRYLIVLNNYALGLKQRGRYQESRTTFETLLKSLREVHGERHPDIANGLNNFALLLLETRSYEEAERAFRAAIEQWGALIGSEHQRTLIARHNLALSLMAQLRFDEAEVLLKEVFDKQSEASGGEIDTGNSAKTLARLMYKQQRTDEGLSYALQSTEILAKKYPVGHFRIAVAETTVA